MSDIQHEHEELRTRAATLLTGLSHGDLLRYTMHHNFEAARHIMALAERKYPADTNVEAKEWYEYEHLLLLATIYKIGELRTGTKVAEVEAL